MLVLCVSGVCRCWEKVWGWFGFVLHPLPDEAFPVRIFGVRIFGPPEGSWSHHSNSIHCHLYSQTPFDAAPPSLLQPACCHQE